MIRVPRLIAAALALTTAAQAAPAPAKAPILAAIQARDWPAATGAAGPDELARLYVTYARLLLPAAATPEELNAFLTAHPDWPRAALLTRRLGEALAALPDDPAALALCRASATALTAALRRCTAAARAAHAPEATAWARRAWRETPATADDDAFHATWSAVLTADDEWARFDALDWAGDPAAGRLLPNLDAARAALAAARLAIAARASNAPDRAAALPPAQHADPALQLGLARLWRLRGDLPRATAAWADAAAAERAAPAAHRPAFWTERDRLARLLLGAGDLGRARQVADDAAPPPDQAPDALFLAGYLALRANDAAEATRHFAALHAASPALITQGRAAYFLGRAATTEAARTAAYTQAASYPTTFYGQLALRALVGQSAFPAALKTRLAALPDPAIPEPVRTDLAHHPFVRLAHLLTGWGDPAEARLFLQRRTRLAATAPEFAAIAEQAQALALPDQAVFAARLAGVRGFPMPHAGWPAPADTGADPLLLGLMRQESSFDPAAVSPSGAIGLTQIMPATGMDLARAAGLPTPPDLFDPTLNARLGALYLHRLLAEFGAPPSAVAAYNAGPGRLRAWLTAAPPPPLPLSDPQLVDWVETIPLAETRNYVQRVLENAAIYAARGG